MLLRKILLSLIIICISITLIAQEKQDIVYLKNGSIIKGEIIEQKIDESVTIRTSDGNTWIFELYKIERIEYSLPKAGFEDSFEYNKTGFTLIPEFGFLILESASGSFRPFSILIPGAGPLMFHLTNSYITKFRLGMGFGTGLENIDGNITAPLYLDLRYEILDNKGTPFVMIQPGYTIILIDNNNSQYLWGGFINFGGGIRKFFSKGNSFAVCMGIRHQEMHFHEEDRYYGEIERSYYYTGFFINMSLLFR